jgi:hypothetical protein
LSFSIVTADIGLPSSSSIVKFSSVALLGLFPPAGSLVRTDILAPIPSLWSSRRSAATLAPDKAVKKGLNKGLAQGVAAKRRTKLRRTRSERRASVQGRLSCLRIDPANARLVERWRGCSATHIPGRHMLKAPRCLCCCTHYGSAKG